MTIIYQTRYHSWYATQKEAAATGDLFVKCDAPTDRAGLCKFLNNYREELLADSGVHDAIEEVAKVTEPVTPTVQPDDSFEDLPLAQQLHLACLALENARSALKGERT